MGCARGRADWTDFSNAPNTLGLNEWSTWATEMLTLRQHQAELQRSTLVLNRAYILLIWPSWMYLLLFIILVYLDCLSKLIWYGPRSSNIYERVQ